MHIHIPNYVSRFSATPFPNAVGKIIHVGLDLRDGSGNATLQIYADHEAMEEKREPIDMRSYPFLPRPVAGAPGAFALPGIEAIDASKGRPVGKLVDIIAEMILADPKLAGAKLADR